jgi:hypothetical protein
VFLDTHLRASHHTRFGALAEHPGLPAADDVITQRDSAGEEPDRLSENTHTHTHTHTDSQREDKREDRDTEDLTHAETVSDRRQIGDRQ